MQPLILAAVAGCAPPFRPSQSHRPVHHEFHELQLEDTSFKFVQVRAKKMPKSTNYKAMMSDVEERFGDGYTICYEDSDGDQNGR